MVARREKGKCRFCRGGRVEIQTKKINWKCWHRIINTSCVANRFCMFHFPQRCFFNQPFVISNRAVIQPAHCGQKTKPIEMSFLWVLLV